MYLRCVPQLYNAMLHYLLADSSRYEGVSNVDTVYAKV